MSAAAAAWSILKRIRFTAAIVWAVVGLYSTFVLQNLWNWFVVPSFNLSSIAFWEMYGLHLLVRLLTERPADSDELSDWAEPEASAEKLAERIQALGTEGLWTILGLRVYEKLSNNTIMLAIGWGIHTFLV